MGRNSVNCCPAVVCAEFSCHSAALPRTFVHWWQLLGGWRTPHTSVGMGWREETEKGDTIGSKPSHHKYGFLVIQRNDRLLQKLRWLWKTDLLQNGVYRKCRWQLCRRYSFLSACNESLHIGRLGAEPDRDRHRWLPLGKLQLCDKTPLFAVQVSPLFEKTLINFPSFL